MGAHPSPIDVDPSSFLDEHFDLPPLPGVADRLLNTINSGRATAKQAAELIETDAALLAQILKIVNSAYYGLPRRVADVRHAVAYLGLTEIHRVVLAASIMSVLAPADRRRFREFWYHSFLTALVAKRIAKRFERTLDPEELHSVALLHDVGKLVYMKFFPEHYDLLMQHCESERTTLAQAERHYGLPSHGTFGVVLCRRWRLPDTVADACRHHELQDLREHLNGNDLGDAVRLTAAANLLANLAAASYPEDRRSEVQELVSTTLGCSANEFLLLMGEVYELRSEVERFLEQL